MNTIKFILIIFLCILINACSNEKIIYSGKIINQENIDNLNILNKNILINKFGKPSYVDPIEKTYFYYSEKTKENNFFSSNTEYSYIFVFKFDDNDKIIDKKVINLLQERKVNMSDEETENNIINRGFIERIFGGVGAQKAPDTQ